MKKLIVTLLIFIIFSLAAFTVFASPATIYTPEQIIDTVDFMSVADLKYSLNTDDTGSFIRYEAPKGTFSDGQLTISFKESATDLNFYTNSHVRIKYRTDSQSDTMPCNIFYKHRSFESNSWFSSSLAGGAPAIYSNGLWNELIIDIKDLNANVKISEDHIDMTLILKPFGSQTRALNAPAYFDIGYIAFFETEEEATLYNDPDTKFADMYGHWAMETVNECVTRGLFNGTSATRFSPDDKMTRAMLTVVLSRIEGKIGNVGNITFTDTPKDSWFSSAVAWALEEKIVENGASFRPDSNITREEIADMLYRYAKVKNLISDNATRLDFADTASIKPDYVSGIAFCVNAGIIKGYADNTVKPAGEATRAEVATMIIRFLSFIEGVNK